MLLVSEDEVARVEHVVDLHVLLGELTLDEVLIATELSSVVATYAAVIGAGRSIIEAIDREVHHAIVRILILGDSLVNSGHRTSLCFDAFLGDEEIIIQIALVDEPEVAEGDDADRGEEEGLLDLPLSIEYAGDEGEDDDDGRADSIGRDDTGADFLQTAHDRGDGELAIAHRLTEHLMLSVTHQPEEGLRYKPQHEAGE